MPRLSLNTFETNLSLHTTINLGQKFWFMKFCTALHVFLMMTVIFLLSICPDLNITVALFSLLSFHCLYILGFSL